MKYAAILGGLLLLAPGSQAAENGYGKINLSGVVVDAPCSIVPGADSIEVNFGEISSAALQNGHPSPARDFYLALARCHTLLHHQVQVTFQGTSYADGLFSVGEGNTTVGIELRDRNGQPVRNNQPVAWQRLNEGDNQLHFTTVLKARSPVVSPGRFQTQVLFTVAYL